MYSNVGTTAIKLRQFVIVPTFLGNESISLFMVVLQIVRLLGRF
ncbi:hypothetical protein LEP1GSC186_0148 [Leptospira noguchii serovar Autumnalis str. ZUN142]|uniref:Uncharacterized protein n=1 Tax=Leptospira noguchii serovar Autumnalis str. ZUN142 TaxID=1085540 RepID=M6UCY3_9LEPT|nr:hypothetical protein LEP1GSC186_0148 [Leptospira noguchii serovar Autumnalis str. ZUN142]